MIEEVQGYDHGCCEKNIPGASLGGRDLAMLMIPALKHWLQCRAAPITKGKRAELVER